MKLIGRVKKSTRACKAHLERAFGKELPFGHGWTRSTAGGVITWTLVDKMANKWAKVINIGDQRKVYVNEDFLKV